MLEIEKFDTPFKMCKDVKNETIEGKHGAIMKLIITIKTGASNLLRLVTTKSISFPLSSLLFARPIKNWFSARLSLRQSACKRKGSERALVDTRGRRVRFL